MNPTGEQFHFGAIVEQARETLKAADRLSGIAQDVVDATIGRPETPGKPIGPDAEAPHGSVAEQIHEYLRLIAVRVDQTEFHVARLRGALPEFGPRVDMAAPSVVGRGR